MLPLGTEGLSCLISLLSLSSSCWLKTNYIQLTKAKMVNAIPDKVKGCLSELSAAQQVIIRGYIGTLRAEIKELEEQIRTLEDPDPHAHYHGHEK